MVILVLLITLSVYSLTSYLPKQHLLSSVGATEQILTRAQSEAGSHSTWSCVKFDPSTKKLSVYIDKNEDYVCGNSGDILIVEQPIRPDVSFATTGECNGAYGFEVPIWFDLNGAPRNCDDVNCSITMMQDDGTQIHFTPQGVACTPHGCISQAFEIIVKNNDLPLENRAREIEILTSGAIAVIPRDSIGDIPTIAARTQGLANNPNPPQNLVLCPQE